MLRPPCYIARPSSTALIVMRFALAFVVILGACTAAAEHAEKPAAATAAPTSSAGEVTVARAAAPVAADTDSVKGTTPRPADEARATARDTTPVTIMDVPAVRALYVNRYAAQSRKRMHHLIDIADQTEIDGLVLDMKDEFGLNFRTTNPQWARNAGTAGVVHDLRGLLDTLHAHRIRAIARIVVFKDSVTARVHPEWTIRQKDGSVWRDKKGIAWVNPYHRELWEYNIGIAEELAKLGFDEIQFDYIRFPEPYKSLPPQVFPGADVPKPQALADYLSEAMRRLHALRVPVTADIFGLVTTVRGPLEVGQEWEKISPHVDVVLPMVYPSHYPPGSFGIAHPNAEPYDVIVKAISAAKRRDAKLGITAPQHVRPWLQAFSLGKPPYGAEQVRQQKRAVYDAGYGGWILWSPGSWYDAFVPALEKR